MRNQMVPLNFQESIPFSKFRPTIKATAPREEKSIPFTQIKPQGDGPKPPPPKGGK